MLARTSSESDSSFGTQLVNDIGLSESASGIDLVLLTFSGRAADKQVWLHKEKPGLLSLNLRKVLLRVSLLVSPKHFLSFMSYSNLSYIRYVASRIHKELQALSLCSNLNITLMGILIIRGKQVNSDLFQV